MALKIKEDLKNEIKKKALRDKNSVLKHSMSTKKDLLISEGLLEPDIDITKQNQSRN